MDDQKEKRLVIVDGRYVGFIAAGHSPEATAVVLEDALEIVSALIPQQTPHGIASFRLSMVHPLPLCAEPKRIVVRFSSILFADTDLNEQELKALEMNIKNCTDNLHRLKLTRDTGLVLPK